MTVLASAVHRTVDVCGIFTRFINGDRRLVDETISVVFRLGVLISHATAAAEDRAVRHVVLEHVAGLGRIEHTERAAVDVDGGNAASSCQRNNPIICGAFAEA